MKKTLFVITVFIFILVCLSGCSNIRKKEATIPVKQQFINIATGNVGGSYYSIGAALAEILNKEIPGINASVQSTSASGINANLISTGKVELAFIQNDIAYYAINGLEMFEGKEIKNMQGIFSIYEEPMQIVVLERSGITDVKQFKNKRVAVGSPGSGTEFNARKILEAYGMSFDDIIVQHISFVEAMGNLLEGKTDIMLTTASCPVDFIKDLASKEKIKFLSLDYKKLEKFFDKYPFYAKIKIPKETYKGQYEDVDTIAVMALLVANDKINDELGYKIAQSVYNNINKLMPNRVVDHEKFMEGMTIPLNKGAAKFFSEIK